MQIKPKLARLLTLRATLASFCPLSCRRLVDFRSLRYYRQIKRHVIISQMIISDYQSRCREKFTSLQDIFDIRYFVRYYEYGIVLDASFCRLHFYHLFCNPDASIPQLWTPFGGLTLILVIVKRIYFSSVSQHSVRIIIFYHSNRESSS